jgi:hypothetical protein
LLTDISGRAIGHIFKGQEVEEEKVFEVADEHRA